MLKINQKIDEMKNAQMDHDMAMKIGLLSFAQ